MTLSIFKVERIKECGYDEYQGFVCVAEDVERALLMHPASNEQHTSESCFEMDSEHGYPCWVYRDCCNFQHLQVEKLGIAADHLSSGVLFRDYHAG